MKSAARYVEPGLAVVIVVFFGVMTAANAGIDLGTPPMGFVDDARAAEYLGGICSETGGTQSCGRNTHTCGIAGCTAGSTICTWSGTQCMMLGQLSTPSTFPCTAMQGASNSCQAYMTHQCVLEQFGPGSSVWSCNNGATYCNQSSYCGEALYLAGSPPPNG